MLRVRAFSFNRIGLVTNNVNGRMCDHRMMSMFRIRALMEQKLDEHLNKRQISFSSLTLLQKQLELGSTLEKEISEYTISPEDLAEVVSYWDLREYLISYNLPYTGSGNLLRTIFQQHLKQHESLKSHLEEYAQKVGRKTFSDCVPAIKNSWILNESNLINEEFVYQINALSDEIKNQSGAEVLYLVTKEIPSLFSLDQFVKHLFDKWKIGAPESNGALLVLRESTSPDIDTSDKSVLGLTRQHKTEFDKDQMQRMYDGELLVGSGMKGLSKSRQNLLMKTYIRPLLTTPTYRYNVEAGLISFAKELRRYNELYSKNPVGYQIISIMELYITSAYRAAGYSVIGCVTLFVMFMVGYDYYLKQYCCGERLALLSVDPEELSSIARAEYELGSVTFAKRVCHSCSKSEIYQAELKGDYYPCSQCKGFGAVRTYSDNGIILDTCQICSHQGEPWFRSSNRTGQSQGLSRHNNTNKKDSTQ